MNLTSRSQHAFTLIEVMVVVGIMGIILAMGIPSVLRSLNKEGIAKATSDVVEVCSHARAQAILHGTPMDVVFQSEDYSFRVQPAGDGGNGNGNEEASQHESSGAKSIGHLPDGIAFLKLELNGFDYVKYEGATVFSFRFYPNGTCDDAIIELLDYSAKELRTIIFKITTGLADVEAGQ